MHWKHLFIYFLDKFQSSLLDKSEEYVKNKGAQIMELKLQAVNCRVANKFKNQGYAWNSQWFTEVNRHWYFNHHKDAQDQKRVSEVLWVQLASNEKSFTSASSWQRITHLAVPQELYAEYATRLGYLYDKILEDFAIRKDNNSQKLELTRSLIIWATRRRVGVKDALEGPETQFKEEMEGLMSAAHGMSKHLVYRTAVYAIIHAVIDQNAKEVENVRG